MSRPSDGMELDELRDEFDWMFEFMGRMAERIRGDADVHNLVDYVGNLEAERDQLRKLSKYAILCSEGDTRCLDCPYHDKAAEPRSICMMRKEARELGVEVSL